MRFAIAVVRAWTRLYTWRLPAAVREARRAEIESDLWEFQRDSDNHRHFNPAVHTLIRLLLGVPDDLHWRAAHASFRVRTLRIAAALTATVLFLAALWVLDLMRTRKLPLPPAAPPPRRFIHACSTSAPSKPNR